MVYSSHSNTSDLRLSIMLVIVCLLVLIDCLPPLGKNISCNSLQLYADLNGQLQVKRLGEDNKKSEIDIPVKLAPFFFEPLNVNLADKQTLMVIKGIGPFLSESIVNYRQLHGAFHSIDDLTYLKGIGHRRAEYFSAVLTFGDSQ